MTTATMMDSQTEPGVRVKVDEYFTTFYRDDNCDKHGPFESSSHRFNSSVVVHPIRWTDCPGCAEERKAQRKAEHERKERQERQEAAIKRLEDRIDRAGIPRRFRDATLDNYVATNTGQRNALAAANVYVDDLKAVFDRGQSLLLLGNVGTGKTHLAVGIAHKAMEKDAEVIFTTAADMIGRVKATWGQRGGDSEAKVIKRFADVDLLVLDEVGSIKCAGREREILFTIIGGRHNEELPTIFTANLNPDELPGYLGDQIVSRLRESGSQSVVFGWDDYRPIKGKQAMAKEKTQ